MSANSGRTSSAALLQLQHDALPPHVTDCTARCERHTPIDTQIGEEIHDAVEDEPAFADSSSCAPALTFT